MIFKGSAVVCSDPAKECGLSLRPNYYKTDVVNTGGNVVHTALSRLDALKWIVAGPYRELVFARLGVNGSV